jgi:hypothetical protein
MTGRKLFQLRLKTEKLGRGSPFGLVGIVRSSSLRICGWRGEKLPQSDQLNDQKETVSPFHGRWQSARSNEPPVRRGLTKKSKDSPCIEAVV